MLSQRRAAQAWAVSRATIQRAISIGKLSVLADGTIDPSEMVRVFGEPASQLSRPMSRLTVPDEATNEPPLSHPDTSKLRAEIEHLKAMLLEKDARIEDLRGAMRLLTDQRTAEAPSKGFWARLRGR